MKKGMPAWLANNSGSSAIEFAVLAPVLLIACIGLINGWSLASFALSMRAGVGSAANLYLQGASDDSAVGAMSLQNWQNHPEDAAIDISRFYKCGTSEVAATSTCPGSKAPEIYVKISATGTWTAAVPFEILGEQRAMRNQRVIRVR